jgi:hypothetical protein
MSGNKQQLGQFYTTNYAYILDQITIPPNITKIVEPFAGKGDLIQFIKQTGRSFDLEYYDIDPQFEGTINQDTIQNPPSYRNKFIVSNPPYLARNKSSNKQLFDLYNTNDLYKCVIIEIIRQRPLGGILIIPLNFWSSIRASDSSLRKTFLDVFQVIRVNVFEESVFDDTDYAVCSFQFVAKQNAAAQHTDAIPFIIYPQKKRFDFVLNASNNYTIGGELYQLPQNNDYKIGRLIQGMQPSTNMLLKCIDNNIHNRLCLSMIPDSEIFYDKTKNRSERSYASITIEPAISVEHQKKLVDYFNNYITIQREKYNSLFLTNYRESNSIARKRISFDLAYQIIGFLLLDLQPSPPACN